MITRTKSNELFEEAKKLFPGGVNSPVRAFKSVEGSPLFIKRGEGCRIYDEDGNEFIDFCGSWGPLILGHNDEDVRNAIFEAAGNGCSFGTPTKYGNLIGDLILSNNRFIDKLRFVSSGTEAVMSAIRLARGYTGKSKIVKFEGCYHGHVDSLMVKAGSGLATFGVSTSAGIPTSFIEETLVLSLNDLKGFEETLKAQSGEIAAVIIEPIPANNGLLIQDVNYLTWLRKLCDDYGVLLIFDEVISGFRVGFEGAAGLYSIKPDIITYGKIIGGGMPVGAYGGRLEIMNMIAPDGPVYQAGTLSANPVTLAAGYATLQKLLSPDFYTKIDDLTQYMVETLNQYFIEKDYNLRMIHVGGIFWLRFSKERIFTSDQIDEKGISYFSALHSYLLNRGIYLGPSGYEVGFVSAAHTKPDIDAFIDLVKKGTDTIFNAEG